jgi:hypothetical protein
MGFQTRRKNKISKVIVDIPEEDHIKFKTIVRARGYTVKSAVHNLIKQFNCNKISLDNKI